MLFFFFFNSRLLEVYLISHQSRFFYYVNGLPWCSQQVLSRIFSSFSEPFPQTSYFSSVLVMSSKKCSIWTQWKQFYWKCRSSQIIAARLFNLSVFVRLLRFVVQHFYPGKCNSKVLLFQVIPFETNEPNLGALGRFQGPKWLLF